MKHFNLVVLAVFVLGCSGEAFTTDFTPTIAPDSAPGGSTSTGGAPGTGGEVAAGGAPEADAGAGGASQATGGSSHSTGGSFQETGGSSQTGGSPSTGGVLSTGGAPIETGGTQATDAGCTLVTHDNGAGQTWQDCVSLGTHDRTQAVKACEAWCAENGCTCFAGNVCGEFRVLGHSADVMLGWSWEASNVVHVSASQTSCTVLDTWN